MMGFVFNGIFVSLPTDKRGVKDLHPLFTFGCWKLILKKNPL